MLEGHLALVGHHRAELGLDRDLVQPHLQQLRVLQREGVLDFVSWNCASVLCTVPPRVVGVRLWILAQTPLLSVCPARLPGAPCCGVSCCRPCWLWRSRPRRRRPTRSCRCRRCAPGMRLRGPVGGPGHRDLAVRRRDHRRDRRPDRPGGTADPGARLRSRRSTPPASARASPAPRPVPRRRAACAATPARSPRAVGEYGNHVVLVTPIEEMLRDSPATPAAALGARRRRPRALRAAARGRPDRLRPLAAHARAARARRAAARARRCWPRPPGPLGGFPAPARSCPAPRWPRRSPPATSPSARWAPSPTATAPASGPSATPWRRSAGARCSWRTPTCSA